MATAPKKKAKKGAPAPFTAADWASLFDPGIVENGCECVREAIVGVSVGHRSVMHKTLRTEMLKPLDAYLSRHWKPGHRQLHVESAENLQRVVQRLHDQFAEGWPFDAGDAEPRVEELRGAWHQFGFHALAHHGYHLAVSKVEQAKRSRKTFMNAAGERLTPELLANRYRTTGARQKLAALSSEFGAGVSTISEMYATAKASGLFAS